MMPRKTCTILASFGGPRSQGEVSSFLRDLLTDRDVIRTRFPRFIEKPFFTFVAKRREKVVKKDYEMIGGKSPIYDDTEQLAATLSRHLGHPILCFHRYIKETHASFKKQLLEMNPEKINVFPCFPQFTYATSGSCARWFSKNLPLNVQSKLRWIKSYPAHPSFIHAHEEKIQRFLNAHQLNENEVFFLFSAHGIPKKYVAEGDLYEEECQATYSAIMKRFPKAQGILCYQSQFGKEEWLRPYTRDVCEDIGSFCQERKKIVIIPISFISDHIETLFEIETAYMPPLKEKGYLPFRVPCLTLEPLWIEAICSIMQQEDRLNNQMLIRPGF